LRRASVRSVIAQSDRLYRRTCSTCKRRRLIRLDIPMPSKRKRRRLTRNPTLIGPPDCSSSAENSCSAGTSSSTIERVSFIAGLGILLFAPLIGVNTDNDQLFDCPHSPQDLTRFVDFPNPRGEMRPLGRTGSAHPACRRRVTCHSVLVVTRRQVNSQAMVCSKYC